MQVLTIMRILSVHDATITTTAEGIEDCRKCCGGHGYLAASGLPELLGDYLQNCTVSYSSNKSFITLLAVHCSHTAMSYIMFTVSCTCCCDTKPAVYWGVCPGARWT
jgi:hypothetical protein